ncbi:MAG: tRNA (adenosine(37)-N6)-threonylcarbamoyltransferase complex dimerization subunit type 1 TsaB [Deltaproteobacteria bacterium]|nr:tRNA (adenosine(37)-N6)-threonylcarbamoyltransferase complex dimerization subunit type 1 TsaB [Deltaproteobacteria bacterium]
MLILALDTATEQGGLALVEEGVVRGEVTLPGAGAYLQTLLPAVQTLLAGAGRRPEDLGGLAVSRGPGNFTGLRIGLATAKTLAWALEIPLAAVSTLEVLAAAFARLETPVGALVDAKRQEVYFGLYDCGGEAPRLVGEPVRLPLRELPGRLQPPLILTGPGLTLHEENLRQTLPSAVSFAPLELRLPRAAVLARLGAARLGRGDTSSPESLTPAYLRPAL